MPIEILLAPHGPEDSDMVNLMTQRVEEVLEENPNSKVHLILEHATVTTKQAKRFEELCNSNYGILPSLAYMGINTDNKKDSLILETSMLFKQKDFPKEIIESLFEVEIEPNQLKLLLNLDELYIKYASPEQLSSKDNYSSRLAIHLEGSINRQKISIEEINRGYSTALRSFFEGDLRKSVEKFRETSFKFSQDIYRRETFIAEKVNSISGQEDDVPIILSFGSIHSFLRDHIYAQENTSKNIRSKFLELNREGGNFRFDPSVITLRRILYNMGIDETNASYNPRTLNSILPYFFHSRKVQSVMSDLEWHQATLACFVHNALTNMMNDIESSENGETTDMKMKKTLLEGTTTIIPRMFNSIESIQELCSRAKQNPKLIFEIIRAKLDES